MDRRTEGVHVREPLLRRAFEYHGKREAGTAVNPEGRPKMETVIEDVPRDGLLGKYLDRLLGPRKVPNVRTRYVEGLDLVESDLVELVEEEKKRYEKKKMKEMEKKQERAGKRY